MCPVRTGSWSDSYVYDGFGNLLQKNVTAGSAPSLVQTVDPVTNQIQGFSYDANGNQTTSYIVGQGSAVPLSYDIENRLVKVGSGSSVYGQYAYNPMNQRVWRLSNESGTTTDEISFYGIDGKRLTSYKLAVGLPTQGEGYIATLSATATDVLIYFGGRIIQRGSWASGGIPGNMSRNYVAEDRLGSMRWDGTVGSSRYYPWGEEQTTTANDRVKFATYRRDGETGIDYAMNRFYNSSTGRFLTVDRSGLNVNFNNPGSWNRFAYVNGDPVNHNDPLGVFVIFPPVDPAACLSGGAEGGIYCSGVDGSPSCAIYDGDEFTNISISIPTPCELAEAPPVHIDCLDALPSYEVTFVVDNYLTANSLGFLDGIPGSWILGWAALESFWGTRGVATKNNRSSLINGGVR